MFSSSLVNVLRREANWVRALRSCRTSFARPRSKADVRLLPVAPTQASWKDAGCPPFDLPPLPVEKLEAVAAKRRRIDEQPLVPRVQHPLGTPALSELWAEHEVGGLYDLQNPTPFVRVFYASWRRRLLARTDARFSRSFAAGWAT